MSYSDGEALILTQIQATTPFGTTTTARSDWTLLNRGKGQSYAILRYGGFRNHKPASLGGLGGSIKYETLWLTICEIWVRVKTTETAAVKTSETNMQAVVDRFDARRKAGDQAGVVQEVKVRSGSEPVGQWKTDRRGNVIGTGPKWLKQNLTIEWIEEKISTLAE